MSEVAQWRSGGEENVPIDVIGRDRLWRLAHLAGSGRVRVDEVGAQDQTLASAGLSV